MVRFSLIAELASVRADRHSDGEILALLCRLRRNSSDLRPSRAENSGKCLTSRRRVPDDGGACPIEIESAAFSLKLVQPGLPNSTALHGCSWSRPMSVVGGVLRGRQRGGEGVLLSLSTPVLRCDRLTLGVDAENVQPEGRHAHQARGNARPWCQFCSLELWEWQRYPDGQRCVGWEWRSSQW